jgi:type IV pilus assembly protein PilA
MIDTIKNRMEREEGFTLIELLVVILIIGILAAIAIPSFLNQREKGQDACAKSQARTMTTAMETVYTDNNSYAGTTIGSLNTIETAVTSGGACGNGTSATVGTAATNGVCDTTAPGAQTYCVSQTSASGRSFAVVKDTTGTSRWCGSTTGGGCKALTVNGW